jgi:phosphoribosyl-AMP cyclohydrolase
MGTALMTSSDGRGEPGFFKTLEREPVGTTRPLGAVLDALPFAASGLLPVITQDSGSGEVLMLAWVNREALEETLRTGRACYWSRSRQQLWRKGETSGNAQHMVSVHLDCDGDALLYRVRQSGPACHTGRPGCFHHRLDTQVLRIEQAPVVDPDQLYPQATPAPDGA